MKVTLSRPEHSTTSDPLARHQRYSWVARLALKSAPTWLLVLPVILLLPAFSGFPYPPGTGVYSDLAVSHYPYTLFIQRTLLSGGGLPLWSPAILSGQPLAANPLAGMWYPPGWLAVLLPLPFGLNLLAALHLGWGSLGMYRLLRAEGLGEPGAFLGGLAFALLPKLYAHFGAGHLTLIYAVAWTPWLLKSTRAGSVTGEPGVNLARGFHLADFNIRPGIILALIFLADPRWAVYAGVLWLGDYFAHSQNILSGKKMYALRFQFRELLLNGMLAASLAAPLAVTLWEFTRLSTRAHLSSTDTLGLSLPPARLLGLFFPAFGGFHEWVLYPGALVLLLALMAPTLSEPRIETSSQAGVDSPIHRRPRSWVAFWAVVALLSLFLSLGSYLPPVTRLAGLPPFNLLRVPPRWLLVTGFSLIVLASFSVDRLWLGAGTQASRRAGLLLTALGGFTILLPAGVWKITGKLPLDFAWGAVAAVLGVFWFGVRLRKRLPPRTWYAGLLMLCALDLWGVDRSLFTIRPTETVLSDGQQVIEYLQAQPGVFRVYSPSYSLPQQSAAHSGLELVDGVDPLQLETYADFMDRATGVPRTGYSVTLPSLSSGEPALDNAEAVPDPQALGLLNVRFITAEYDLQAPGLVLRQLFGSTRVYENLRALPRAWLQSPAAGPGEGASAVDAIVRTSDRIELLAQVAGSTSRLLVLSEVLYPGWVVTVDGRSATIQLVDGLLRGVLLEPGRHEVVFEFRPQSLVWGATLGLGGVFILLLAWLRRRKLAGFSSMAHPLEGGKRGPVR